MIIRFLPALWGCLFIVCAGLGFIPEPSAASAAVSLAFFIPPAILLWKKQHVLLIRNLSALSLLLTLVLLIANFLTIRASEFVGTVLYYMLVIVSSPMVASGHWALSLFLWACLLMASRKQSNRP